MAQHQTHRFKQEWQQIDSLAGKGLPESAAVIARKVLATAQQQGDAPNAIKAQLFLMGVDETIHEEATIGNIRRIDSLIAISEGPEQALWQSINAELYWQYYQGNRWTILGRTPLAGEPPADITAWDAAAFVSKASDLYQASILDSEPLKVIPVKHYAPLLLEGKNTRHLRPTLYDLLAFRAIEFFQNDEKDVIKPAYQFQIDGTLWFEPVDRFAAVMVNPRNPEALHFRALHTYQWLLRFHLNDEKPDALIDADLQRLAFVHQYSVHPDKDSLYLQALQTLEQRYVNTPASAQVTYRILQFRHDTQSADTTGHDLEVLKNQLDALIARFPDTEGAANATQLRHTLTSKSLNLQTEEVALPAENSKALLTYRNLDQVYLRIYRIPSSWDVRQRGLKEAEQANLLAGNPLKQWESALPGSGDYREHRTELKIDPLPAGSFLLVASATPDFTSGDNILHAVPFQVSSVSVVIQNTQRHASLVALHRKSGMPIRGAEVTHWENNWNAKAKDYEYTRLGESRTDEDGVAPLILDGSKNRRINRITVVLHGDTLQTDGYHYRLDREDEQADTRKHTFLFTDRAIYRPGQTVHFKGIMVEHHIKRKDNTTLANEKTDVTLYDANGQEVAKLPLVTNAWGSFSGKFTAPTSGLTGQMRIGNDNGDVYISVEEYKRPKFHVAFDTVKSAIALHEQVTVKGRAQAYAGNSIDGAQVSYRVVRRARFPYFWAFHRWGQPQSPEMEIANGTVATDGEGAFEVPFTPIPDQQINPQTFPVFTYTVYVDVTDINGETQSGSYGLHAGYRSLEIQATIAEQLDARKPQKLTVHTENLNGVSTPADVSVSIAPLRFPGKLYRKRLWEKPDRYTMTEAEFRTAFPDDEYGDEADYLNWPPDEPIWKTTLHTGEKTATELPAAAWKDEGWHLIELTTTDPQGNTITEKQYTYVTDPTGDAQPQTALLMQTDSTTLQPDQRLAMTVKTGYDSTYVLESNTDVSPEFTTFSETRHIDRPITEGDRGGLGFHWLYVYNNRVYTASKRIDIPWTNRDLQLEWATHRDKLLPGEQEAWRLTIKGDKKDAVAAELLAGLYDASLDALKPHGWQWDKLSPVNLLDGYWNTQQGFGLSAGAVWQNTINGPWPEGFDKQYDQLVNYLSGYARPGRGIRIRGVSNQLAGKVAGVQASPESALQEVVVVGYGEQEQSALTGAAEDTAASEEQAPPAEADTNIPIRTNLQETAFFLPQLQTDAEGNVTLEFTLPEALTEWKLMAFAHTQDWKTGYLEGKVKTQKDLMVMPNLPRFLRQGDDIRISAKVSNISAEALAGVAQLTLLDAATLQPISDFGNSAAQQDFSVAAGQSATVHWDLQVPGDYLSPVVARITAKAGNFTDGEENTLPVITNRMLVTETLPLPVRGNETKTFQLEKLAQSTSNTLVHHALTVEFTGNPAWYAVQALPYLMEYPYECAEQVFNRFYANALASHIVSQAPTVKAIFDRWKTSDTTALLSNLEKNQELKSALLEETPWVMEAKDESEQKHRIALLFDSHKLAQGLEQNLAKLAEMQLSDGSFPWFRGMMSNRYITQYLATGIARLQKLGVAAAHSETAKSILQKAVDYLDRQVEADYDRLLRDKAKLDSQQISPIQIQYLYLRSMTDGVAVPDASRKAYDYYVSQAADYWQQFNPYLKGQLALALQRMDDAATAADIVASLRETAIRQAEMGMYWKAMPQGYWWYEAPIEAQALLIETFAEVAKDTQAVDDLKVWLLKQKQTQHWNTTKATADAIYALLLQGSDWLANEPAVTITLGDETIRSTEAVAEAGTGYFKKRINGDAVVPEMGNISVSVDKAVNEGVAWGTVYWQYFENLDKITAAETPLSLRKQLYIERNTDSGPVLEEITAANPLKVGDKVKVRIELRVDRDMEYVHLKDMRAACFEPVNVLSGHRYQGGLGYYESTRDVATNFFFDYLRKGTYVFEYPVFVSQAGDFSNGISTIQCMYAPEFSSHSEGIRVRVK
ncbi:alpha-2-macroglobulin family protein [Parapedobacter sp. DT-150]|uniref:alpha-2-macroglobulin family protein n=1 Tax=Parapedobacter sp. DT-150 TaxID=3396162 RepID=UPI003F19F36A